MIKTNFSPFPLLTTDRLILRPLEMSDDTAIFEHRKDEKVITYLDDFSHSSIEQTRAFILRVQKEIAIGKSILWVITEKGRNKFIGSVCLWNIFPDEAKAEAGYTLDSKFHKRGYMQEALEKIIDFGFHTMQLKTIEAYTHEKNESSIKLLVKNGFVLGTTPKKGAGENRVFFITSHLQMKQIDYRSDKKHF